MKAWVARHRYLKLRSAAVQIQKNMKRYLTRMHYKTLCKAALTIGRYFRGWKARRKYEAMLQQMVMRPSSRHSVVSMNSFGYYSLTASTSVYSLNPSLADMSPCSGTNSDVGFSLSGESLRAYLSPEHHRRLQETEESGIETDTESINGETGQESRRVRKLRRRAQLQKLLEERAKTSVHRVASEESLTEVTCKPERQDCIKDSYSNLNAGVMKSLHADRKVENVNSLDEKVKIMKVPLQPQDSYQRMRVTTMRSIQEVTNILKDYCPSENLQMVLPKQNLSLYFKDGVLSYRRMPVVCWGLSFSFKLFSMEIYFQ